MSGGYRVVTNVAARDAIPTPGVNSTVANIGFRKEGMLVYTQATNQRWILGAGLTNADWTLDGGAGSAITPADYTAKGVILVGTAPGAETALSVGVDGLVLTADSTQPTGVKWDVAVPGGGAIPEPSPTIQHLYVSGLNGNDVNDGSSPLLAVATLARAFELIPYTLAAPFVIHLGKQGAAPGAAYAWSPMPSPAQLTPDARIWLYGDGAGQAGEDGFDVVAGSPGVAAAGTDANQITTAAIVANAYQGFTLEVVNGPAAGYRRTILTNTTSSIIPCRRFESEDTATAVVPVAGNTIRILRPNVIFSGYDTAGNTDGIPGLFSGVGNGDGGAPLFLVNLAFASVTNQTEINRCSVFGAGVEFRGTVAPIFTNCNGSFGNWDNVFDTSSVQAALPQGANLTTAKKNWFTDIGLALAPSPLATWRGWGVSQPDITAVTAATTGLRFLSCQMSMFATVGDLHGSSSTLTLGGRFWGDVTMERGFYHLIGRANLGIGASSSSIFARKIRTELATVIAGTDAGPFGFTYAAAADHQWTSVSSDVTLSNNGVFTSTISAFLKMTGGGTFELNTGAFQFNHQLNATSNIGLIQVAAGTFTQNADFQATNSLVGVVRQGASLLAELSGVIEVSGVLTNIVGNAAALSGSYGVVVQNGGQFRHTTAVTLTGTEVLIDGGNYIMSADLTSSTANGQKAITLQNQAFFEQTTGFLTLAGAGVGSGIGVDGSSGWLSSGGSASVSVLTALTLGNSSRFMLTAGVGAWSMTSTGGPNAVSATGGSQFFADSSSLTLSAGTAAISAQNSEIILIPTTLTFSSGGISLSDASSMFVNASLVVPGTISVSQDSELTSVAAFTANVAATVTTSRCVFNGGTTFLGALTANLSEMTFNNTVSISGALNFDNTHFNHTGNCTLLGLADGENSSWDVNDGNLSVAGTFTMTRCNVNVNGTFGTPTSVSLIDTNMSVSSTYACTNLTSIVRSSKLVVTGTLTSGDITLTGDSELMGQGAATTSVLSVTDSEFLLPAATLSSLMVMTRSKGTFTGNLVGTGLSIGDHSDLHTAGINMTNGVTVSASSSWVVSENSAICNINTAFLSTGLTIEQGSIVDLTQLLFTMTIHGVLLSSPAIRVDSGSELYWKNITLTTLAASCLRGIDFRDGGQLHCEGAPTNINGAANADFFDNQGPFNNSIVIAGRTVFTGQHPAGAYSLTFPSGSGFVTCK